MAYLNSVKPVTGLLTGCQFQVVLAPRDSWSLNQNLISAVLTLILHESVLLRVVTLRSHEY